MLFKRKTETNLRDARLFVLENEQNLPEGAIRRTSSPLLERKSLSCPRDCVEYQLFCEALRKPLKRIRVLDKGGKMPFKDESLISGHFFTREDHLDLLNQPIIEDDIKRALSTRILNLLNDSYKSLVKKTHWIFGKKWGSERGSTRRDSTNHPECGCRNRNFVDLKQCSSSTCSGHKRNVILI